MKSLKLKTNLKKKKKDKYEIHSYYLLLLNFIKKYLKYNNITIVIYLCQ